MPAPAPPYNKLSLPFITRLKLVLAEWAIGLIFRSDTHANRRLYSFIINLLRVRAPATKLVDGTARVTTADIPIDPSHNLWFRLFVPHHEVKHPLPFIVHFHGGGFYALGPDTFLYDGFCTDLAARVPAVVASVNYRLSPEHRFPSQYDDGFDALKFFDLNHSCVLPANADLGNCFIAGDSAGGNIAHHVTVRACRSSDRFDKLRIVGLLSLQPFFGGEDRTESEIRLNSGPLLYRGVTDLMWRCFLPLGVDRDHRAANVMEAEAETVKDLKGFPPAVVVVGGWDPLQDWNRRYVEWLSDCGKRVDMVEFPNAIHAAYVFPELAEYPQVIYCLKKFIHEQIRTGSPQ